MNKQPAQKPNYGIDSPWMVLAQAVISLIGFAIALADALLFGIHLQWAGLGGGAYFLLASVGMLHYSKIGKIRLREQLLSPIPWRGDEKVLDCGCGPGLLLAGAARRLTTGLAVGVDLWLSHAISGNEPSVALANCAREGAHGRATVAGADVKYLPFADASFDVVVSNFVLHEMATRSDRCKMLCEMTRVLKPGGRLALADFIFTNESVAILRNSGAPDAARRRLGGWQSWIPTVLMFGAFQLCEVRATRSS